MKSVFKLGQVAVLDTLGVMFMIAALLTGWLPGPGGVPLFIIGLSLLSVNHAWAKRYRDWLRKYADRLGDFVFIKDARVEAVYDLIGPALITTGAFLIYRPGSSLLTSFGISCISAGLVLILGNRGRWAKLKKQLKLKR